MAINLLSNIQCKNATSESRKIRKLSDGERPVSMGIS